MQHSMIVSFCLFACVSLAASESRDAAVRLARIDSAIPNQQLNASAETDLDTGSKGDLEAAKISPDGTVTEFVRNKAKRSSETPARVALVVDGAGNIDNSASHSEIQMDETGDTFENENAGSSAALMQRSSEHEEADVVSSVELLDKTIAKKGHGHPPQHCAWNAFGGWGACDKECGGGSQTRSRTVKTKAERGGNACTGAESETQSCNTQPCPINCEWDRWDDWSDCSKECGGGEKKRSREKKVRAQHGGMDCDGDDKEEMDCNTHDCPTTPMPVVKSLAAGRACSILASAVGVLLSIAF